MQGVFWRRFHLGCVFAWFALWATAIFTGWVNSSAFISHISMLALVLISGGAWQAARAEVVGAQNPPQEDQ